MRTDRICSAVRAVVEKRLLSQGVRQLRSLASPVPVLKRPHALEVKERHPGAVMEGLTTSSVTYWVPSTAFTSSTIP